MISETKFLKVITKIQIAILDPRDKPEDDGSIKLEDDNGEPDVTSAGVVELQSIKR